jgi:hypothetical protein
VKTTGSDRGLFGIVLELIRKPASFGTPERENTVALTSADEITIG